MPGWGGFLKMKNDILEQIHSIDPPQSTGKWMMDGGHPTMLSIKSRSAREKNVSRQVQESQIKHYACKQGFQKQKMSRAETTSLISEHIQTKVTHKLRK